MGEIVAEGRRISLRKTLILIPVLTGVAAACTYAILEYQHWYAIHNGPQTPPSIGPDGPPGSETFWPGRAVPEQPAITNVEIVTAEQADSSVDDDEIVIGVVIDGEARASKAFHAFSCPRRASMA